VYSAPSVKPGAFFVYFDPIDQLSPDAQRRWEDPVLAEEMIAEAMARAGGKSYVVA
jgi:lysine 2,3-aminomutase